MPTPHRTGLRPKDAASLLLVRNARSQPEFLMGRRAPRHTFMPDVFVFPGGAVNRSDGYARPAGDLRGEVLEALTRDCTPHRARAIALAGIRETFEETGLMLARPADGRRTAPRGWEAFARAGLAPALDELDYVAHAITPPGPPRRFHARFFLARADDLSGTLTSNGELLDLDWFGIEQAVDLPAPYITKLVLRAAMTVLRNGSGGAALPLILHRRGKRVVSFT
ncbi:MAG TPA: NUDIX hydrolase [Alphaproteobacteria bacterium]|jgi:8-oxo-dGTP pyrophosphatase MutT (NUDIX family)|nr:NUDIX hydrolase [Alphaproteobacteria bacterium]